MMASSWPATDMNNPNSNSKKFSGQEILRDLIPLNALTDDRYRELTAKMVIQDVPAGHYLFGEGDRDNRSIYLLDGVINFIDTNGRVTGVVSAGTDPARYPMANQQPRTTTARAATKSVIAAIDSTLLDVMLTLDQSAETGAMSISATNEEDWMSRMLQSEAFSRLSPSDIQRLIQSLQSVSVNTGDVVIRQGDEGDYFYIVREGKCSVTRLASGAGWDVPLAELGPGDSFGEDALASDSTRNATITMLTDGLLMRLSKQQFVDILKKPMVRYIEYDMACAAAQRGEVWIDVRTPDEFQNFSLEHSTNLPLASIRDRMKQLDATGKYLLYCDTGRRSAAAAFLLGQRGFNVQVLDGGLNRGVPAELQPPAGDTPETGTTVTASSLSLAEMDAPAAASPAPSAGSPPPAAADADSDLVRQRDAALEKEQAAILKLEVLQDEMAALKTGLQRYTDRVMQVEIAHEGERTAREQLIELIERLLPSDKKR